MYWPFKKISRPTVVDLQGHQIPQTRQLLTTEQVEYVGARRGTGPARGVATAMHSQLIWRRKGVTDGHAANGHERAHVGRKGMVSGQTHSSGRGEPEMLEGQCIGRFTFRFRGGFTKTFAAPRSPSCALIMVCKCHQCIPALLLRRDGDALAELCATYP